MTNDTGIRAAAMAILAAQRDAERYHTLSAEALTRGRNLSIALARTHGLTWTEIADILGTVAPNTIRMRYERGL